MTNTIVRGIPDPGRASRAVSMSVLNASAPLMRRVCQLTGQVASPRSYDDDHEFELMREENAALRTRIRELECER